jgi:transcriptional regulator with XRE-family HTH domain
VGSYKAAISTQITNLYIGCMRAANNYRAGWRIPALRRAAGVSQAELAERLELLGLTRYGRQPRISRLEQGRMLLTIRDAEMFAEVLGTTPEVIMAGTEDGEVARAQAELDALLAQAREHQRQLRTLEVKLEQRGSLTKAERKRFDELAAQIAWARSMARLYRSRMQNRDT